MCEQDQLDNLASKVIRTYVNGGVTIDGVSYKQIVLSPALELRPLVNTEDGVSNQEAHDFDLCVVKMSDMNKLIVSAISDEIPYSKNHSICTYESSMNIEIALKVLYPKVLDWLMVDNKEFVLPL